MFLCSSRWEQVRRTDWRARALADRHYSRQTVGASEFLPPGRTFVLITDDARAVWGVCENYLAGARRWRVTIFRNEGGHLSSELCREATVLTVDRWRRRRWKSLPLTTEVDASKVRHKRDPGRCFLRSGLWVVDGETAGGLVRLRCTLTPSE
jgi:hypothetical protein